MSRSRLVQAAYRHYVHREMSTSPSTVLAGRRVVARFLDGRIVRGTTRDFAPDRPVFHLHEEGDEGAAALEVPVKALKALFFVRSLAGVAGKPRDYDFEKSCEYGRRCVVTLVDGEVIPGLTTGLGADRPGFFLTPADPGSNNERVFVVRSAVASVAWAD